IAKKLLDAGADPDTADRSGRTAALVAVRSGHSAAMVRFLDRELTPRSVARQTALLAVLPVCRTVKECARLVSVRGERAPLSPSRPTRRAASPALVNKASGRSPQPAAGQRSRFIEAPALAAVSRNTRLLSRPALRAARIRASAALSASAKRRRLKKLNAALKRDPARVTPLMLAAVNPNAAAPEIIAYLLEKGEALEAKDGEGRTPLICAVRYNPSPLAAETLLNAGADPRATIDGNGLRRLLRFNERMSPQDKKRLLRLLREKLAR
ncbi:MAG: ankyrin repeat domain-containing protein, partial [Pyramidobacter porci]|uniref:ankyrin repeat domain-containing protein n=1 Tax=Pyramidobacter porci TaxID=2605789 RepID=UPI002A75440B